MAFYQLLKGRHLHGGKTYDATDPAANIVESEKDLEAFAPGKFRRLPDSVGRQAGGFTEEDQPEENLRKSPPKKSPKVQAGKAQAEQDESGEVESELGFDVTEQFDLAEGSDLRVLQKGSWYYVVSADDPNSALNEKALKKDDVQDFLDEQDG